MVIHIRTRGQQVIQPARISAWSESVSVFSEDKMIRPIVDLIPTRSLEDKAQVASRTMATDVDLL